MIRERIETVLKSTLRGKPKGEDIEDVEYLETGNSSRGDGFGDGSDGRARGSTERGRKGVDSAGRAADYRCGLQGDAELAGGDAVEGPRAGARVEAAGDGAEDLRAEGGPGRRYAGVCG